MKGISPVIETEPDVAVGRDRSLALHSTLQRGFRNVAFHTRHNISIMAITGSQTVLTFDAGDPRSSIPLSTRCFRLHGLSRVGLPQRDLKPCNRGQG